MKYLRIMWIWLCLCASMTMGHCAPSARSGAFIPMSSTSHYLHPGATTGTVSFSTIPLTARRVEGGMTSEQTISMVAARRVIIHDNDDDGYGDENLRPGYDPNDPFGTPIGETPFILFALMAAAYVALRKRLG